MNTHRGIESTDLLSQATFEFQCQAAHCLNVILEKAGINDATTREKVCEDFVWELSKTFEGEPVHVEGVPYFPLLCFATSNETDAPPTEITDLNIPTNLYAPHDSSCDAIVQVFGDGP